MTGKKSEGGADDFSRRLLAWFDVSGRHDLPWQHPRTAYRVWLSEIMLQQTQVKTAAPYFLRFVAALPTLQALAAAPLDDVLALWAGLGYYARGRNLHATAQRCMEVHDGDLPRDIEALTALPGIGRSTAAAILAQAWGDPFAILDGNVKRVLARYHGIAGWTGQPAIEKQLWALAESHLPQQRLADYTQAQMDLGATLCTRARPACVLCPLQDRCVARREGRIAELPTRKPGRTLPQRHAHVLWIEDGHGAVLLQRRPPAGIWASMWTLPQADDADAARMWFDAQLRGDFDTGETLPVIAHAFSHYKLALQPLRWREVAAREHVRDNGDLRWVPRARLSTLGIPAPIRTLLDPAPLRPSDTPMPRTVFCLHEQRETEGLDFIPWPGELGKRVFAGIGKAAWAKWLAHQTMLINENRLSPMDPKHRAYLAGEMEKFLFSGHAEAPAGYVPPAE